MKSGFFKYIFLIFVIIIIVSTIYFIYFRKEEKPQEVVESKEEYVGEKKDIRLRNFKF